MLRTIGVSSALGFTLLAVSCSTGPQPPQPGTPAFLWNAAKTTYKAGDFLKANDSLSQLSKSASDFKARSQPWSIVLSAGIAQAYMNLADSYEAGAKANRANPTPFRRQVAVYRSQAAAAALEGAETIHQFLGENKADSIALETLGFPAGSAAEPVALQRVAKGMLLPPAEGDALAKAMVQRGVLLSATHFVGAGDDSAKAQEAFKAPDVKVAIQVFLMATAKALTDQAELYGPKRLDNPDRLKVFCNEAEEALRPVPPSKETKDLTARIDKLRKPSRT
jgi:hypothetical protein